VAGAWDVAPCAAPCVVVWTPEEYPWEPPPGRELQPQGTGWYYTGDYAGCDDCGSALLGDTSHIVAGWTLSFTITVYGTSFDSTYSSRQRVQTPGGTLYWDGTSFVPDYPSSYHQLPAGTYRFSFDVPVIAETKIQVMMGLCNDSGSPECPYKDRPWLLDDIVVTAPGCGANWDQEIFYPCPGAI
jgi:hypothetical protein